MKTVIKSMEVHEMAGRVGTENRKRNWTFKRRDRKRRAS